jgi:hypothetical protein
MSMVWARPAPLVEGFAAAAAKVFGPASLRGGLVERLAVEGRAVEGRAVDGLVVERLIVEGLAVERVVVELDGLEQVGLGARSRTSGSTADWNTTASASARRWAATFCISESDFANLAAWLSMADAKAVYT